MYKPVKVNIEFLKFLSKTYIMPKQDMSCSTAIYCTIFIFILFIYLFFTLQNSFWLKKKIVLFFFSHCFYCSEKLKQCLGWIFHEALGFFSLCDRILTDFFEFVLMLLNDSESMKQKM